MAHKKNTWTSQKNAEKSLELYSLMWRRHVGGTSETRNKRGDGDALHGKVEHP